MVRAREVWPCMTCTAGLNHSYGVKCPKLKTERQSVRYRAVITGWGTQGSPTRSLSAELRARLFSKKVRVSGNTAATQYFAQTKVKGHNPSGQVMTPRSELLLRRLLGAIPGVQETLQFIYLVSDFFFIVTCKRAGRWRREGRWQRGETLTETVGAREVVREMEFAGCVWDRFASWSCKCILCLHVGSCHILSGCVSDSLFSSVLPYNNLVGSVRQCPPLCLMFDLENVTEVQ